MDLDWDNMSQNQLQPQSQAPEQQPVQQDSAYEDEWEYEEIFEDEEEENPTVNEAIKRIEQAKLYESLLKHDFFAPGSARAEIQDKVTSEIRDFILERLSELVGITTPKAQQAAPARLPWDDMQVQALTAVANRLVQKKTGQPTPAQPVVQQFAANTPQPMVNVAQAPAQQYPQQPQQQQRRRKVIRKKKETQPAVNVNLPPGTKIDPATGNPVSDNGAVLYKGQKTSKKTPPKRMPSPQEEAMLHQQQVQRNMRGASVGDKMLNLAISSAQYNNRNIVEELNPNE